MLRLFAPEEPICRLAGSRNSPFPAPPEASRHLFAMPACPPEPARRGDSEPLSYWQYERFSSFPEPAPPLRQGPAGSVKIADIRGPHAGSKPDQTPANSYRDPRTPPTFPQNLARAWRRRARVPRNCKTAGGVLAGCPARRDTTCRRVTRASPFRLREVSPPRHSAKRPGRSKRRERRKDTGRACRGTARARQGSEHRAPPRGGERSCGR